MDGRVDDHAADAGNGEHRLDHDGRAEQAVEKQADHRQHGTLTFLSPCFHRIAAGDRPFARKRPDVLRRQHLDQRAAQLPRDRRRCRRRQRERGQGGVRSALPTPAEAAGAGGGKDRPVPARRSATSSMASQKLGTATPSEAMP